MKKLASLTYDVTDLVTAGQIQYLVEVTEGKDELVKNAHVPSLEEIEGMPDSQFALVLFHPHIGKMKKLAMSDKYLTELNMRIFADKMTSLPEELVKVAAYHLCKAAKHYGLVVPEPIAKYATEKVASNWVNIAEVKPAHYTEKTAAAVEYALNGKYPIHTPELVKKAMQYFGENWKRFSPRNAFEYAVNVKLAADKLGISYANTRIEKYASVDASQLSKHFRAAVLARKGYTEEDNGQAYDDLVKEAKTLGPVKTAEVLEELDRKSGVYREWNKSVEDPIFTVFDIKKEASVKIGNIVVTASKLQTLPSGIVDEATLADLKSAEGLDVFESLPTPLKVKLAKCMETDLHGKGEGVVDKAIPTLNKPTKAGNFFKDTPTSELLHKGQVKL
jgi:hypothetical protein